MSEDNTALARRLETLRREGPACCEVDPRTLRDHVEDGAFEQRLGRFEALGDRKRLLVVSMLAEAGEVCACELQAALDVTHATVSHHAGVLEQAGLVEATKRGRWVYYRLSDAARALLEVGR